MMRGEELFLKDRESGCGRSKAKPLRLMKPATVCAELSRVAPKW